MTLDIFDVKGHKVEFIPSEARDLKEVVMQKEEPKINCPTFQKQEPVVKELADKINKAKDVRQKAKFAEELQKEVNVLLNCSNYDAKKVDCMNCHTIAKLRMQTANLIIRAKKLAK